MRKLMRFTKGGAFLIGVAWAAYSMDAIIFLSRAFPSKARTDGGVPALLASVEAYAVVFGPALIATFFLILKWPESTILRNANFSKT